MTRRRILPIFALLMLLASLLSTETAEVWCRVAAHAILDADDDDSLYFTCRQAPEVSPPQQASSSARPVSERSHSVHLSVQEASVSAASPDGSDVDEPTFTLPPFGVALAPGIFLRVVFPAETMAYAIETRGPPAILVRLVRPPPRAPPVS